MICYFKKKSDTRCLTVCTAPPKCKRTSQKDSGKSWYCCCKKYCTSGCGKHPIMNQVFTLAQRYECMYWCESSYHISQILHFPTSLLLSSVFQNFLHPPSIALLSPKHFERSLPEPSPKNRLATWRVFFLHHPSMSIPSPCWSLGPASLEAMGI